jgi:hypothetical protein
VTSGSGQTALVTGEHPSEDRSDALLPLCVHTAEADQSLGTILSGWQSAEVRLFSQIRMVARVQEGAESKGFFVAEDREPVSRRCDYAAVYCRLNSQVDILGILLR